LQNESLSDRVPFGTGQRMQRFMNGGMDEYRLHDFNIFEIRAYVVAFTPNCSGKIKENLNRDGVESRCGAVV